MLLATAINRQTNKRQSQQRLTIVKTVGFVFTPATSTAMSIVQIGGFYTTTKEVDMITAGSRAAKMLARLRKKTHLYTKGEQTMIKSGIMKRKYKKKLNMKNAKNE